MGKEDKTLLLEDEDWISSRRFNNSLERLLVRYPDGCPTRIVASALCMTEDEVDEFYRQVVIKLRNIMGVSDE